MALFGMRRSGVLAALMLVGMAANGGAADGLRQGSWVMFGAFFLLGIAILGVTLRVASIDFGRPQLSCEQHVAELIKASPSLLLIGLGDFLGLAVRDLEFPLFVLQVCGQIVIGLNVRGAGLVTLSISHLICGTLILMGIFQGGDNLIQLTWSIAFCTILGFWTKYMHDQRLVFTISHIQLAGGIMAERWIIRKKGLQNQITLPILFATMIYLVLLLVRKLRRLPPELRAVRFLRLGFVRGGAACGGPLRRCQEMPVGAFGDVRKAMVLIPVSHRWIDREACDAPTPAFPMGLRLGTMRRLLNTHFSPTRAEMPNFARRVRHAVRRRAVGGWDAVVFFDFCCVPQIPRSEEEERTFRQCLPHMGTLYSMFPTAVLHEVPHGVHGYLESGWCFCEFETARLGKQLSQYSRDAAAALGRVAEAGAGGDGHLEQFVSAVEAGLEHKSFFIPADADVVRRILSAFALKRMMLDAIEARDMEQLRSVIDRLQTQGLLQSTLDQPVNQALETPLHVAVRRASAAATQVLLDKGANPACRNLRGDTPAQRFMLPRCSGAARLVRAAGAPGALGQAEGAVIGRAADTSIAPDAV